MFQDSNEMEFRVIRNKLFERQSQNILIFGILMAFLVISILFLNFSTQLIPPTQKVLQNYSDILGSQAEGMKKIPDIETKIRILLEQTKLLSTSSIENRLKVIEDAIHVGSLKPEQISTLVDVKKDLETLKTYMFSDPKDIVDLKQLQVDYRKLLEAQKDFPNRVEIESKISFNLNLLFLTWAFLGIIFTIVYGKLNVKEKEIPTEAITRPPHPAEAHPAEEKKEGNK